MHAKMTSNDSYQRLNLYRCHVHCTGSGCTTIFCNFATNLRFCQVIDRYNARLAKCMILISWPWAHSGTTKAMVHLSIARGKSNPTEIINKVRWQEAIYHHEFTKVYRQNKPISMQTCSFIRVHFSYFIAMHQSQYHQSVSLWFSYLSSHLQQ